MKKADVPDDKKNVVSEFVKLMDEYPIIGAVNMEGMPAPQLQNMRALLRKDVIIKMAKRRLIKKAIEQCKKKDLNKINEYLRGMPALIFTKENPFKLFKTIQKNKSNAPAKAGQTAPSDIIVKAGPTSFAPGPIIGELGSLGIKTSVEGGKVAIQADKVVVPEGEQISGKCAGLLTRLGIEPMEVGLDLVATYEDGNIFTKKILAIDEDEFMGNLEQAGAWAMNLAIEIAYPTKDTIEMLITKSFNDAKGLALEQNILADAVVEELLTKAEREMLSLKDAGNIEVQVAERKEEAKPEEPKVEEKKEEAKPEAPKEEKKEEPKVEEKPKVEIKPLDETKKIISPSDVELVEKDKPQMEEVVPEKEEKVLQDMKEHAKHFKEEVKKDIGKIEKEIEKSEGEEKEELEKEVAGFKEATTDIMKEEKEAEKEPTAEEIIEKTIKAFPEGELVKGPSATELVEEVKKEDESNKEVKEAEDLLKQLQKKGTLREGAIPTTPKKEKKKEEKIPSAHELAELAKKKKKS